MTCVGVSQVGDLCAERELATYSLVPRYQLANMAQLNICIYTRTDTPHDHKAEPKLGPNHQAAAEPTCPNEATVIAKITPTTAVPLTISPAANVHDTQTHGQNTATQSGTGPNKTVRF